MIILYISHLSTNISAGLNWSVPASVNAQERIDKVLWINMTEALMPHWPEVEAYHNVKEYGGKMRLEALPMPFNHPDIVVFEGLYYIDDVKFARVLYKQQIPYIIIPRGSLNELALRNHARIKKWIAHKLLFDSFINRATAIQYLTKQESISSSRRFKTPFFIVPNGISIPEMKKSRCQGDGINAVFIGRLDIFHKGIDLLLEAISALTVELDKALFHLSIYGPQRYDYYRIKDEIRMRGLDDFVSVYDEICGDEKSRVLLNADLFIMTSRFEGHPMGLIEALAYGLPCLVTPGTNMAEEISSCDAGWVTDCDSSSIQESIKRVVNEKHLFLQKGENAQQLASHYQWEHIAMSFHEQVANMLESEKIQ